MARGLRTELPDGTYHVTARGVDGTDIVRDDDDRRAFLNLLAETLRQYRWDMLAFCLMNTHYHLVLHATRADLSAGLHRLNGVHAQRFNIRHTRKGHLFGDRFASWVVETEEHRRAACRYVLLNPVRAGLCERSEDWRWSGSRFGRGWTDQGRTYVRQLG